MENNISIPHKKKILLNWNEFPECKNAAFKIRYSLNRFMLLLLLLLSHFSRVRLCNPIDGSPPSCPVPGTLQSRTPEWVVISFSSAWKWKVKVKSLSHVQLSVTPWTAAHQAPLSMGFSSQEYWSGVPLPSRNRLMNQVEMAKERDGLKLDQ